jgi:hypothetical protein
MNVALPRAATTRVYRDLRLQPPIRTIGSSRDVRIAGRSWLFDTLVRAGGGT